MNKPYVADTYIELRKEGKTILEIAKHFNVTRQAVSFAIIKRYGSMPPIEKKYKLFSYTCEVCGITTSGRSAFMSKIPRVQKKKVWHYFCTKEHKLEWKKENVKPTLTPEERKAYSIRKSREHYRALRSTEIGREYLREQHRRYWKTPKGQEVLRKSKEKHQERMKNDPEYAKKYRAVMLEKAKKYQQGEKYKDFRKRYTQEYLKRPEVIARRKAYQQRPEVKARNRERQLRRYYEKKQLPI